MSQVSYGTITITDTNDIERIYVEYCRSTSNQLNTSVTPPVVPNITVNWSENTPPWVDGQYIWQRSVVKKSGSTNLSYGTPVCLTGAKGGTGASGQSLTATKTQYTNAASNVTITENNHTSYTWTDSTPEYDATKPVYWGRITNTYTNPAKTEYLFYKDQALTDAIYNAYIANSIATHAQEDAEGALSQAAEANLVAEGLQSRLKYIWINEVNSASYPAGTYAASGNNNTFSYSDSSTYGFNSFLEHTKLHFRYNAIDLNTIGLDGLKFYNPIVSNSQITGSQLGMELTSTALTFYNPTTGNAQLTLSANGSLQSGNYSRGSDTKFADTGTKIDLTSGDIITEYFRLSQGGESGGPNAGAYIHGTIEALNGRIGGYTDSGSTTNNYWDIGNFTDYNLQRSAKMIGHGSSFIQLGDDSTWRLATNRIHTGWYVSSDSYLHFLEFTDGSETKRWDYGMHVPTSKNDKFLYIRNASSSTSLANLIYDLEDTNATHYWTYKFWIDGEGKIHAPGFYIGDSDTPIGGGAGTVAEKLMSGAGSTNRPVYFPSSGDNAGKPVQIAITDNSSATAVSSSDTNLITARTLYYAGYTKNTGTVTSVGLSNATNGGLSISGGPITTNGTITIGLASAYGDTKNPYGTKTKNYVLAGPTTGSAAAPTFRALVAADIPDLSDTYLTSETTYSFTGGTNKFTVTPSVGTAYDVTITPSISNNVTGSGTSGSLVKWNGTNTVTDGPALGTDTTKFLNNKGEWAVPGGTYSLAIATYTLLGGVKPWYSTTGTSSLANSGSAATYTGNVSVNQRSTTSGKYYPIEMDKNGRMFVNVPWTNVNASYLTSITSSDVTTALGYTPYNSTNPDGYTTNTGTVTSVKVQGSNGLTGSGTVTTSGTITLSHADTSSQSSSSNSGRTYIQSVTLDDYGHVTGLSTATETVTDTHHTAYLYDTTSTGTTRVTTNTTDPYLTLVENGTARSRIQLKAGTNITSITANNGVITFAAKDTTYTAATAAPGKIASSSAQGSSTNYARQDHTHGIDLATGDANGQVKIAGTNVSVKGLGSWAYKSSGSASDVGLNNVTNYSQITKIGDSGDGKLRVWTGDPDGNNYTDVTVHITAYDQSTVAKAAALDLSAKVGDTNKPVYFTADGTPAAISYTINKSVPSDAVFTDTTYTFDGTYNASTNKAATVSTVTNAINALDGGTIGTPGTGKTITAISQSNGNISVTFGNISITKSQISDFPSSMTPAAHNHSQIVTVGDQRSTATTPNSYSNALIFQGLKNKATIGSPSTDTYSYLVGLRGWSDSSGGNAHEIAFNDTGVFVRRGATTTWGSWERIYTTGNKPTASDIGLGNVENKSSATIRGELTSSNVTTALGYTPYNSTNPNGYTANTGTVTSVKPGNGLINGTSGTSQTAITGSGTISMASITRTNNTSTASPAHGGTFTAIDSVTTDDYGRVTAVNTKTVTLPADNNTDTKVTQAYSTTNNSYPLLMTATAGTTSTSSRGDTTAILTNGIYANPSSGTITATTFSGSLSGNASSATEFSSGTTVKLTGNVTGESSSSKKGWTISTTIGSGVVTNAMLAGSIANSKLTNSSITINSTAVSLGGSISVGTVTKVTAGTGLSIGTTAGGNFTTTGTINHTNSVTAKTAAAQSGKTLAWGETFTLYEEKYDAEGHITGVASYNMTMPSNPNSDTKVKLNSASDNTVRPLIFGPSSITSGSAYEGYYNTNITVNPSEGIIKATKGIFNELVATSADITNLTATNAKVVGILDVTQGELHTSKWTNANISNIGGSFYISPTVNTTYASGNSSYMTVTISGSANSRTIAITGGSFATDAARYYDSTGSHVADWAVNSKVMITGNIRVGNTGVDYPLGTCVGRISGSKMAASGFTITGVSSPALESIITELGTTSFKSKDITISMYEIGDPNNANTLKPVGIMLTSYGTNNSTYIDIYGGVNTKNSSTGLIDPNVRIGYLGDGSTNYGLEKLGGSSEYPKGWGIYTDNGYFKGMIVADSGKIGGVNGWTIAENVLYSGSHSTYNAANDGIFLGKVSSDYYVAGGNGAKWYLKSNGDAKIGEMTYINGTLSVPAAKVIGSLAADTMSANIVTALNGKFSNLQALSANLGGWTIEAGSSSTYGGAIYKNTFGSSGGVFITPGYTTTNTAIEGTSASKTWTITAGANFGVTTAGKMYATNAVLKTVSLRDASNNVRAEVATIGSGTSAKTGLFLYDGNGTAESNITAQFTSDTIEFNEGGATKFKIASKQTFSETLSGTVTILAGQRVANTVVCEIETDATSVSAVQINSATWRYTYVTTTMINNVPKRITHVQKGNIGTASASNVFYYTVEAVTDPDDSTTTIVIKVKTGAQCSSSTYDSMNMRPVDFTFTVGADGFEAIPVQLGLYPDLSTNPLLAFGIGNSDTERGNAFSLESSGTIRCIGSVYADKNIMSGKGNSIISGYRIYMPNNRAIRGMKSASDISTFSKLNSYSIGYVSTNDNVILGDNGTNTYIRGSSTTISNCANMQSGSFQSSSCSNNSYVNNTVTFDTAFSSAPMVVACLAMSVTTASYVTGIQISVLSISKTGFTVRVYNTSGAQRSPSINWIAVMPSA